MILAGVSISFVFNSDGLFEKTAYSAEKSKIAKIQEELELLKTLIWPGTLDAYMDKLTAESEKYRIVNKEEDIERLDNEHAIVVIEERYQFLIYTDTNIGTSPQKVSSRSSGFVSKSSNIIIEFQGEVNTGLLVLSAKKGEIQYPNEETIQVLKNTSGGALSVVSADDSIASARIEGDNIIITSKLINVEKKNVKITVISEPVGKYKRQMAKYTATIKKGSITIEAEAYEGEFDGQRHPTLSNVRVDPTDAKVTYSLNGGEYQTEIPEVEMTGEYTVTIKAEKEGYEITELTKTVTIRKQGNKGDTEGTINPNLVLSPTSGTITYPTPGTFEIVKNTSGGELSVSSSDESTVTASIEGNIVTLIPQAIGANTKIETITVKARATDNYEEQTATYIVTVIGNRAPVFAQNSSISKIWNSSTLTTNFTVTARATDEDTNDTLTYTVYMKPASSADTAYKAVGTSTPTAQGQNATINITQYNGSNLASYTDYNWKVAVNDGNLTVPIEEGKINTTRTYCRTYKCTSGYTSTVNCTTCNHTGKKTCDKCKGKGQYVGYCGGKLTCTIDHETTADPGYYDCMFCSDGDAGYYFRTSCSKCNKSDLLYGHADAIHVIGEMCYSCARRLLNKEQTCSNYGDWWCTECSQTGKVTCNNCSGRGYNTETYYCPSHNIASSHWYCGHSNNTNANYHN